MKCPFCGNDDTAVKDSRPFDDGLAIRRRRECGKCTERFTTFERIQLRNLKVVKRNGERSEFVREKLERSVRIALRKRPLENEKIEQMISRIVQTLEASGVDEVPSELIGKTVMDELAGLDHVAYIRFASVYRDFQDAEDFGAFLKNSQPKMERDREFLNLAIRLADAQTGRTGLNPAVGCVIVRNGTIVGRGATADGGRPHAERVALGQAGDRAKGATAYVTLEPCAHFGQTPPCANALIEAGIARVVCPWRDPNPQVDAQGFERMRQAGIQVERINAPLPDGQLYFFTNQILKRPFIAIKMATSLDGHIALQNGESQWISGEIARRYTRALRARFHGIAVGANTVLADNPALTTRLAGLRNPRPIIFDNQARTPKNARIFEGERAIMVSENAHDYPNCDILCTNPHDLPKAMEKLLSMGMASILVEGGAGLAASLLKANLVDRIYHVATGAVMGADALSAIGALGLTNMENIPRGNLTKRLSLGADSLLQYDFNQFDFERFLK